MGSPISGSRLTWPAIPPSPAAPPYLLAPPSTPPDPTVEEPEHTVEENEGSDEELTQEYELSQEYPENLADALRLDQEGATISFLREGEEIPKDSPYLDKLLFLTCKYRLDDRIIFLLSNKADYTKQDEERKTPFDHYLEAGGNLAELLFEIEPEIRFNCVLQLAECGNEWVERITTADLMMALSTAEYREYILNHLDPSHLIENLLKFYAQLAEFLAPHQDEMERLIQILEKFSLDQQKDFFSHCTKERFKTKITRAYLERHPELNQLDFFEKKIRELNQLIGINDTPQIASPDANADALWHLFLNEELSLFQRTFALTTLSEEIVSGKVKVLPELKERIFQFKKTITQVNLQLSHLYKRLKDIEFWQPSEEATSIKKSLECLMRFINRASEIPQEGVPLTSPSLLNQIETIFRIVNHTDALSKEKASEGIKKKIPRFDVLDIKFRALHSALIELAKKDIPLSEEEEEETISFEEKCTKEAPALVAGAEFDWDDMMKFFFEQLSLKDIESLEEATKTIKECIQIKLEAKKIASLQELLKVIHHKKYQKKRPLEKGEKEEYMRDMKKARRQIELPALASEKNDNPE